MKPHPKKTVIRVAWGVAGLLTLLLLVRTFVGDVYHVESGSMEPTIHGLEGGGEWVFVRYDRSPPERYELVVIMSPGESAPIVKRVIGEPYESLQIVNGDVWIDHALLRAPDTRPPLVTLFDQRWMPLEKSFRPVALAGPGGPESSAWTEVGGEWRVDTRTFPPGSDAGLMYYASQITDGYLTPDHAWVGGQVTVNDVAFECDVFAEEGDGRLRLALTEQGDRFEVELAPARQEMCPAVLTRRSPGDHNEVLGRASVSFAAGRWHHVRFANVDNYLALDVDGNRGVLAARYEKNEIHPGDVLREGKSIAPRVFFGGDGAGFRFRGVRILRDLYYTPRGDHGTQNVQQLGPEQYFLLGDNSDHSRDSREWGPVQLAQIIGRAEWVVWPPSRWRRLAATGTDP